MYSRRQLSQEIESVGAIRSVAEIYQEIAAISIMQIRGSVAKTRNFLAGVAQVYAHTKQVYVRKLQLLLRRKKDVSSLSFVKRNGREVSVFISANQSLYGDLVYQVFKEFIKDVKQTGNDAVVIGSLGKAMAVREDLSTRVEYFDLADYKPEWTRIQEITSLISQYEKINVYYGEFRSILNQIPTKSDISGGVSLGVPVGVVKDYIFEPSPEKVLAFFETQIVANLFHQKIYEAQLARFAARLVLMNNAADKANKEQEKINEMFLKFKKYLRNKKQLSTFSGRMLWEV